MWNKVRMILLTGLMVITTVMLAVAQDNPNCNGDDNPDDYCPLDNWVWVLVLGTLTAAVIYSKYQRKKLIITA